MRAGCLIIFLLIYCLTTSASPSADTVILEPAIIQNSVSSKWKKAIIGRIQKPFFDSIVSVRRALNPEEIAWMKLIASKAARWNSFRDSLNIPFEGIALNDTIYVMTGAHWVDDGFTFEDRTVCFDLTALQDNYGAADKPENNSRIDRLFAHEYTHLLHKAWAKKNRLQLRTFADSILWECLYEGIGMYRSLSEKWLPKGDSLPEVTQKTLRELCPIFTAKLNIIRSGKPLSQDEKRSLQANLSRGPVANKWGAFPVAIWLLLQANGDERRLIAIINQGPSIVYDVYSLCN